MEKHFIPNPSLRSKENLFRFVYTRNSPRFLTPDLFPCWIPINRKLSPHALGCVRLKTQGALPNCEGRAVFLSIAFQNSLSGVPAIPFFSWSIYLRVTFLINSVCFINSVWFTAWNDVLFQGVHPVLGTKVVPKDGFWPSRYPFIWILLCLLSPTFIWHLIRTVFWANFWCMWPLFPKPD